MTLKKVFYQILIIVLFLSFNQQKSTAQIKAELGGRLFMDAATYVCAPDTFDYAAGIPDVRLRAVFKLPNEWKTKIDVKFANNKISLSDAFIEKKYNQHIFRAGFMFGFFGLDQSYSTNDYPFLTGSNIAETFYPGRRTGVSYNYSGMNLYLAAGLFCGDKLTTDHKKQGVNSSFRLVYHTDIKESNLLHVGTSFYYRIPDQDKKTKERNICFSNKANTYISSPSIFNTNITHVHSQIQWGAEFLAILERLFFQTEFMMSDIKRNNNPTYHAYGYYGEIGWLINGKMLNYDEIDAVPYCTSTPHTIMLFARYNLTNLNDTEIKAGKLQDIAVGINYYLNANIIFRLNYSHQWTDVYSCLGKRNWGLLQGRIQFKF